MGVTKVDIRTLPKNPLEFNLPGMRLDQGKASYIDSVSSLNQNFAWGQLAANVPLEFTYYNLQIPQNTTDSSYSAWVAARKA